MARLGDTATYVVDSQVHAYELVGAQDYPKAFPALPGPDETTTF